MVSRWVDSPWIGHGFVSSTNQLPGIACEARERREGGRKEKGRGRRKVSGRERERESERRLETLNVCLTGTCCW